MHQAQDKSVVRTMRNHVSIKVGREEEIEQCCAVSLVLRGLLVTNLDTIFLHTTHGAIEKEQISRFAGFIYRSIQGIDDLLRGLVIRPSLLIKRHSKCCSHPLAQWVRVLGANQTRSRETARKWCGPNCDHGHFGQKVVCTIEQLADELEASRSGCEPSRTEFMQSVSTMSNFLWIGG